MLIISRLSGQIPIVMDGRLWKYLLIAVIAEAVIKRVPLALRTILEIEPK